MSQLQWLKFPPFVGCLHIVQVALMEIVSVPDFVFTFTDPDELYLVHSAFLTFLALNETFMDPFGTRFADITAFLESTRSPITGFLEQHTVKNFCQGLFLAEAYTVSRNISEFLSEIVSGRSVYSQQEHIRVFARGCFWPKRAQSAGTYQIFCQGLCDCDQGCTAIYLGKQFA